MYFLYVNFSYLSRNKKQNVYIQTKYAGHSLTFRFHKYKWNFTMFAIKIYFLSFFSFYICSCSGFQGLMFALFFLLEGLISTTHPPKTHIFELLKKNILPTQNKIRPHTFVKCNFCFNSLYFTPGVYQCGIMCICYF